MIGTGELLIIFLAILLLFGGKKLPELARSLGQAMREFRSAASKDPHDELLERSNPHDDTPKKELPKSDCSPSE